MKFLVTIEKNGVKSRRPFVLSRQAALNCFQLKHTNGPVRIRIYLVGHQEAITFYNTNGSNIDLSAIPRPVLTNVTAENVVGIAPVSNASNQALTWSTIKDLAAIPRQGPAQSINSSKIFKRDTLKTAKIERGAALFPSETGVQSIVLPQLLSLNNSFSKIPVPIPNVSLVSYAKVNTLAHTP